MTKRRLLVAVGVVVTALAAAACSGGPTGSNPQTVGQADSPAGAKGRKGGARKPAPSVVPPPAGQPGADPPSPTPTTPSSAPSPTAPSAQQAPEPLVYAGQQTTSMGDRKMTKEVQQHLTITRGDTSTFAWSDPGESPQYALDLRTKDGNLHLVREQVGTQTLTPSGNDLFAKLEGAGAAKAEWSFTYKDDKGSTAASGRARMIGTSTVAVAGRDVRCHVVERTVNYLLPSPGEALYRFCWSPEFGLPVSMSIRFGANGMSAQTSTVLQRLPREMSKP